MIQVTVLVTIFQNNDHQIIDTICDNYKCHRHMYYNIYAYICSLLTGKNSAPKDGLGPTCIYMFIAMILRHFQNYLNVPR